MLYFLWQSERVTFDKESVVIVLAAAAHFKAPHPSHPVCLDVSILNHLVISEEKHNGR